MTGVHLATVEKDDEDVRLDRWFKRHYPQLTQGRLQKLLRSKQIKVDGKKAQASQHLFAGQVVRIPPSVFLENTDGALEKRKEPEVSAKDAEFIKSLILYKDDNVLVLNKPSGLSVQGGTGITRHLDGLLSALRFEKKENPRLVHRLDKDTSGVLVLARTATAAAKLSAAFRNRQAKKIYWALVFGVPEIKEGKICAKLLKCSAEHGGESVRVDEKNGRNAVTLYRVVDQVYEKAAWLELMPLTGRTHQLRVHCAFMGHPIIGDSKYAGAEYQAGYLKHSQSLHLHARGLCMELPDGKILQIYAPLPEKMAESFDFLGFSYKKTENPFQKFPSI